MEVPSGVAGGVKELRVKLGDSVSEGDVIAVLEAEGEAAAKPASKVEQPATQKPEPAVPASKPSSAPSAAAGSGRKADIECALLVLGAGPGGYPAARSDERRVGKECFSPCRSRGAPDH